MRSTALRTRERPNDLAQGAMTPSYKTIKRGQHVYVIDDDDGVRTAIVRGLEQLGYDVHPFPGAAPFLDGAVIFRPAVVLVDLRMPRITGIELQARLIARNWDAPIIFISGESSAAQSVTALQQGAVDFLTKPFDLAALASVVAAAMDKEIALLESKAVRDDLNRPGTPA